MSNTFNVRYILKTDKINKKGLAPIFARIIFNRNKIEITTNRSTEPNNWLSLKENAFPLNKENRELNRYLDSYKGKIFSAYSTLLSSGVTINGVNFKEAFFGKPVVRKHYLEIGRAHV